VSLRLLLAAGLSLVTAVLSGAVRRVDQQATFRARTDVVSVAVSVKKGRMPVADLRAEDFTLRDNGVLQTIDAVSLQETPIDVTLVITNASFDRAEEHRRGLRSADAAGKRLRPSDRLRLVWVDDRVTGQVVAPGHDLLTDPNLGRWLPGRGIVSDLRVNENGVVAKSGWGTALADGLFYALAWPVDPDRRHLVVAFTDGYDTQSTLELERLPDIAVRSDAVMHAVFFAAPGEDTRNAGGINIVGGGPVSIRRWQADFRLVDDVVQQTGGLLHRAGRSDDALEAIINDFRTSYLIRYTPRGVTPGGWHALKIKIARPGSFTIRARKGYEG
jgi:VWFA-related protein